jgi:5'-phosphate synthase pdxT subunit
MHEYGFPEKIRSFASCGKPIFGTCAGLIVLANKIHGEEQNFLHLIDINIERNAYGRQIESREVDLTIEVIGKKAFRAVFIRAPQIKEIGNDVISLASYEGLVIMARQKNILVATFHPELTGDLRIHNYFFRMIREGKLQKDPEPELKTHQSKLQRISDP